jgi:magnesium chelatase subunit I
MKIPFPFSAIVGQEEIKQAILLTCVDPSIGGVLALGDRGTGKSTTIRALAALLPPLKSVVGCHYSCDPTSLGNLCEDCLARKAKKSLKSTSIAVPVVDLPLGATEDRVVGALDLEKALAAGVKSFAPGLLAQANRGFLYIDEVNLLDDHLVDLLIDVAASGENLVERDGLSVRHPARFVLIGSGNPEEGELRPQLLDRFGLSVEVRTPGTVAQRVDIVKRRDAFERDPEGFHALWEPKNSAIRSSIVAARKLIATMSVPDSIHEHCARLCIALGTDGLRGELTLVRAARAQAALDGKKTVTVEHLKKVAASALKHRLRRNPLDDSGSGTRVERALAEVFTS